MTNIDTQEFNKIEKENRQIVTKFVQMEGTRKPTEADQESALKTINALLKRKQIDTKDETLNKLIMILQKNKMFNEISVNNLFMKSKSFKSSYYYKKIYKYVKNNYNNYIEYIYGLFNEGLIVYKDFLYNNETDFFEKQETINFIKDINSKTKNYGFATLDTLTYFQKYSNSYIMNPYYQHKSKIKPNFKFDTTKLKIGVMDIIKTITGSIHTIMQNTNNHFNEYPIFPPILQPVTTTHPDHSMGTTMHPDHSMGIDHSMGTTMHPDHSMGIDHSMGTTMHPDHSMGTTMHPDHSMGTTMHPDYGMGTPMHPDYGMGTPMHPDHIYDRELNNDILNIQQKMRNKVKKEILNDIEEDIEEDIERQEKILQSLESYHSSCGNPELEMLKQTSHPLTSHKTSSFEKAKSIRTPYDKHWLRIYNGHSLHENYSLDNFKSIP